MIHLKYQVNFEINIKNILNSLSKIIFEYKYQIYFKYILNLKMR